MTHEGRIGVSAPLARALVGAGAGDLISFAGRADAIEVLYADGLDGAGRVLVREAVGAGCLVGWDGMGWDGAGRGLPHP